MSDLQIKIEYLPTRCEICHQTDLFEPRTGFCLRCQVSNISKMQNTSSKIYPALQPYAKQIKGMRIDPSLTYSITSLIFICMGIGIVRNIGSVFILFGGMFILYGLFQFILVIRYMINGRRNFYRVDWVLKNIKPTRAEIIIKKRLIDKIPVYYAEYNLPELELPSEIKLCAPRGDKYPLLDQKLIAELFFDPTANRLTAIKIDKLLLLNHHFS